MSNIEVTLESIKSKLIFAVGCLGCGKASEIGSVRME
jgi:hypothetical protein